MSLAAAAANRDTSLNPATRTTSMSVASRRDISRSGSAPTTASALRFTRELAELLRVMCERFDAIELVGPVPRRPVMGVYGVRALTIPVP